MSISAKTAVEATNAKVRLERGLPLEFRVVSDTRAIKPGEVFLALRGERFDGHAFIAQALAAGAAAIIAQDEHAVPPGVPALIVPDTKRAYMQLALAAREQFDGRVVAITGSSGKTTTKHLLAQILSAQYGSHAVLSTPANENNEIGVSKLLLSIHSFDRFIVAELGARHFGEIAELAAIVRPHIGVLTNIGEAHLEIFGSREQLAETKWGLFSTGAQAVLGGSDAESISRAPTLDSPPLWFGTQASAAPGVWIPDRNKLVITVDAEPQSYAVDIRLPGEHNRANLAAAIAAALLLGADPQTIVRCIPSLTLPAGRFESIVIEDGPRIIYDAYNANLSGMLAALDAFAAEPAHRHIAVLSSMAELGTRAPEMHERVGAKAAALRIDTLLVSGDFAESLAQGALTAGFPRERVLRFSTNEEAAQWLRINTGPRDMVLLKGSRKYAMEQIVEQLRGARA